MNTLLAIILSTTLVSLLAFIGILTLALNEKLLERILLLLVALSAGALLGGAFLHLIPEAIEHFEGAHNCGAVLWGFILFFLLEKVLHWRHCHKGHCEVHTFAYMNLVGDAVHNLIDGLIIAASFVASIPLGLTTTLAVVLHEIPQEIGDFGVLVYGGFPKWKALAFNFFTAVTAVGGGVAGYFLTGAVDGIMMFLLPFTAGGFIYIAASDLLPELRKTNTLKDSVLTFTIFVLGILLMQGIKLLSHAAH